MNIVTANCHTLVKFTKIFNAVVESLLVVRLVVVSIPHGGLTAIFRFSQCFTTDETKAVVCATLSVG